MLQVVFLEFLVIWRKAVSQLACDSANLRSWFVPFVMQEVVCQVVAYISKDTTTIHGSTHVPILPEDGVRQFPKRSGKSHEQCWRHNKPKPIHRKVMVNAVNEEVSRYEDSIIRHFPNPRQLSSSSRAVKQMVLTHQRETDTCARYTPTGSK
jgi:hypothetical protein